MDPWVEDKLLPKSHSPRRPQTNGVVVDISLASSDEKEDEAGRGERESSEESETRTWVTHFVIGDDAAVHGDLQHLLHDRDLRRRIYGMIWLLTGACAFLIFYVFWVTYRSIKYRDE